MSTLLKFAGKQFVKTTLSVLTYGLRLKYESMRHNGVHDDIKNILHDTTTHDEKFQWRQIAIWAEESNVNTKSENSYN